VSRSPSRSASPLRANGTAIAGSDADLGEHLKQTSVIQGASANAGEFFPTVHTLFSNIKA
jgi:hypothetical protein